MTERRFVLTALAFFALVSVFVFAPNLPTFSTAAIGDAHSDALKHVWGQWWVHRHLTEQGSIPLEMDLANFPDYGRFYCLDTVNALFTVGLRPFMNATAAYNVLYLLHLALAAWAAFFLAREVSGSREAALVAGVAYAFSPYVLSFPVASGVAETSFLFPLPLVVLFGLRTIKEPGFKNPILTAVLLLMQGLAAWSFGIYAALFLFALAAAFLVSRLIPGGVPAVFGEARLDRRLLLRGAALAGVLLLAALPMFFKVQGTVSGDDVMYERHLNIFPGPGPNPIYEPALTSFAWVDFFLPGEAGRRADMYTDKLLYVAYAGFAALLLAALGLARRRRAAFVFGGVAVLFFIFALGPLFFTDHARSYPAWTNPIYLAFYYAFPLFNATIHSVDRFAVAFQLALGVLAAVGLAVVLDRVGPRGRLPVALVACLLLLGEYLLVSPAPWPLPQSPAAAHPVSRELAAAPGHAAVLDIPAYHGGTGLFVGDIFFQQTVHARPIPYNLEGVSRSVRANPFYGHLEAIQLAGTTDHGPIDAPAASACSGVPALAAMGFGELILRPDRLAPDQRNRVVDLIESCLGPGRPVAGAVLYPIHP
jgi:hypothetical protein